MGHSSSKEANPELFSKPQRPRLTLNQPSFNNLHPKQAKTRGKTDRNHAPLDESMIWQSPWTGDLLPKATPEAYDTDRNRGRSFPSFSALQRGSSFSSNGGKRWSTPDDHLSSRHEAPLSPLSRSSSYVSRKLSKKKFEPRVSNQQPSKQIHRRQQTVNFPDFETADKSLPCYFGTMAKDTSPERSYDVPLIRRKSLRAPGIPMRPPPGGAYLRGTVLFGPRQMDSCSFANPASRVSRWPLREAEEERDYSHREDFSQRAVSPVGLDYSPLGGFKRGSLRIVNRSASPANSSRARHRPRSGDSSTTFPKADSHTLVDVSELLHGSTGQYSDSDDSDLSHTRGRTLRKDQIPCSVPLQHTGFQEKATLEHVDIHTEANMLSPTAARIENKASTHQSSSSSPPPPPPQSHRDMGLLNQSLRSEKRSSSRLREVVKPSDVVEPRAVLIPGGKLDQFPGNNDSGYSSMGSANSDRSSNPSNSPPQRCQMSLPGQEAENRDILDAESQYLLLCEPRDNELYLKQSIDGIFIPRAPASPEHHVAKTGKLHRKTPPKDHKHPRSPRYYANIGPTVIPPVPDGTIIFKGDSDSDTSSNETDSILSLHQGRLSAFDLTGVTGRNTASEDSPNHRSPPLKDNVRDQRRPSESAVESRLRSLSEPRYRTRHRSASRSSSRGHQVPYHTIPPVPRIPSKIKGRRSSPNAQFISSRQAGARDLPRGRTRSRTVGPESTRLVNAQQVSMHKVSNVQIIDL